MQVMDCGKYMPDKPFLPSQWLITAAGKQARTYALPPFQQAMIPNWPPEQWVTPRVPVLPALTFFRCSFCLSRNSSRLRSSSRRARASWMCALPTFSVSRVTVWPLPGPVRHPPSSPPTPSTLYQSAFQPGSELDHTAQVHTS